MQDNYNRNIFSGNSTPSLKMSGILFKKQTNKKDTNLERVGFA